MKHSSDFNTLIYIDLQLYRNWVAIGFTIVEGANISMLESFLMHFTLKRSLVCKVSSQGSDSEMYPTQSGSNLKSNKMSKELFFLFLFFNSSFIFFLTTLVLLYISLLLMR